jgi:hypothetical protein
MQKLNPKHESKGNKKKNKKTPHLSPFSTKFVLHKKKKNCNESSKCMQRGNLQTKNQKKPNQTTVMEYKPKAKNTTHNKTNHSFPHLHIG